MKKELSVYDATKDELSCYIGQIKVIAWMPLPEPYKERWEDG